MSNTPNLDLPLLTASQSQKHVTHNESISLLDGLTQLAVLDRDLTSPPTSPAEGDRYLVASGATGDWSGWDSSIAMYSGGVWVELQPKAGWLAWVVDEGTLLAFDGTSWTPSRFGFSVDKLELSKNTTEPTIAVHNTGGAGGATFEMIDDNSLGNWKFKITNSGSFKLRDQRVGNDRFYIDTSTGYVGISTNTPSADLEVNGAVKVGSYTVATLPSASSLGEGSMIFVSDESGGPVIAFSDGTNWRRVTDRAIVS